MHFPHGEFYVQRFLNFRIKTTKFLKLKHHLYLKNLKAAEQNFNFLLNVTLRSCRNLGWFKIQYLSEYSELTMIFLLENDLTLHFFVQW